MENNWNIRKEAFGGRTIDTSDMFFVEINNKYLVKIQAGSYAEAEHKALDLFGVQTANAIHAEEKSSLWSAMLWLEPMSTAELEAKSRKAEQEANENLKLWHEAEDKALKLWDSASACADSISGVDAFILEATERAWKEACRNTAKAEAEAANVEI